MADVRIPAELRTQFGKGAARKIRRANKVPAVLYGHGSEPKHLTLPGHELMIALRTPNVLIQLEGDGINELALPKGVQRDPLKGFLQHVDLLLVRRGEKVTVELPITVVGDVVPDGLLEQQLVAVSVTAEATHIPESVEVNVEGMEIGTQLTAGQIQLPQGVELAEDPEALVLHVVPKPTVAEPEAAEGEEGEAASAE
ncbi:50S ribosomal protein L25/general stress protein Ctc [Thermostaphylospora chromogena]|uniref:Large ribosomal subunit protein bL25 n=1 Tax=Thermostaphylospora chromogena TaxID=35622 RepID=A0A1H1BB55_9ACTN|nr:50S ribosomal protein L25/general stress protein Ctc [Thermostaphylospora chromogena]SDQ49061.1 large subunit ribosomal protein L25 [Thermostaphylospora chromogena]